MNARMNRGGRRRLGVALVCTMLSIASAHADATYTDAVAAIVNDEVITVYDVAVFAAGIERQIRAKFAAATDAKQRAALLEEIQRLRKDAARQLIEQKLIYAEFESRGYRVPKEMVEKRVDAVVASQAGGSWSKLEDMLVEQGMTLEDFRDSVRHRLAVQLFLNKEVNSRINISPEQIERFRAEHPELLQAPTKVHFRLIQVQHGDGCDEKLAAITAGLKQGKSFAELAKAYTDGPGKSTGGDMGWLKKSDLRPEFREALGDAEKGATTAPLTIGDSTCFGHISDVATGAVAPPAEICRRIEFVLTEQERRRRHAELVEKLRTRASVRLFFKE